jgi:hypothetical protein
LRSSFRASKQSRKAAYRSPSLEAIIELKSRTATEHRQSANNFKENEHLNLSCIGQNCYRDISVIPTLTLNSPFSFEEGGGSVAKQDGVSALLDGQIVQRDGAGVALLLELGVRLWAVIKCLGINFFRFFLCRLGYG